MTRGTTGNAADAGGALDLVDVHTDLMCPWAYQASLWLRSVRDQTGLRIRWRWFSLEEVNHVAGKKHPWERDWAWGWSLLRIGAWLRDGAGDAGGEAGEDAVDRWCAAAGRALHVDGRKVHTPAVARAVLAEAGLDPAAVDAAIADPRTHDVVRADHQRVAELGGFGVPTLVFVGEPGAVRPGRPRGPDGRCRPAPVGPDDRVARVPRALRAAPPQDGGRLGPDRRPLRPLPDGP